MKYFQLKDFIEAGLFKREIDTAMDLIYSELYWGEWGCTVPPPPQDEDVTLLYSVHDDYIAVHRNHPKFGPNVVEFGINFIQNAYVFFDYAKIEPVCKWIDLDVNDPTLVPNPNVPTYYALPSDRLYYGTDLQKWDDNSE